MRHLIFARKLIFGLTFILCLTPVASFAAETNMQSDKYEIVKINTSQGEVAFRVKGDLIERQRKSIPGILIIRCSYPDFSSTDKLTKSQIRIVVKQLAGLTNAERLAAADHSRPGRVVERFIASQDGFDVFQRYVSNSSDVKTTIYLKQIDGVFVTFEDPPPIFHKISVERRFGKNLVIQYQVDKIPRPDFLKLDRDVMSFISNLVIGK